MHTHLLQIFINIHLYAYIYINLFTTYIYVHTFATYIYKHTFIYIYLYAYIYIITFRYIYLYTNIYIHLLPTFILCMKRGRITTTIVETWVSGHQGDPIILLIISYNFFINNTNNFFSSYLSYWCERVKGKERNKIFIGK